MSGTLFTPSLSGKVLSSPFGSIADMSTSVWQSLRVLRSRPPGAVNSDERRAVFTAALEQSEQLMRAAGDVGYAARPLPLFYSLSQAGRAIAAARLAGPAWRLAGHGIRMRPDQDQIPDLLMRSIRFDEDSPKQVVGRARRKSFAGVSDAIGSELPNGEVELGAVWAAMPDLVEPVKQMPPPPQETVWRRPLRAYPMVADGMVGPQAERLMVMVDGLPAGLNAAEIDAELEHYVFERPVGVLTGTGQLVNARRFSQSDPMILTPAGPLVPPKHPGAAVTSFHDGVELPVLVFPGVVMMSQNQNPGFLDRVVPLYRQHPTRLFCPRLGEQKNHVWPLLLWWSLLFGLSSVARYDPEMWVIAIDVNVSPQAVPIENALDLALEVLPELVLDALTF